MASLAETNKYLRDPKVLERIVTRNALASSVFEGASLRALTSGHKASRKESKIASSKKSARSE